MTLQRMELWRAKCFKYGQWWLVRGEAVVAHMWLVRGEALVNLVGSSGWSGPERANSSANYGGVVYPTGGRMQ